MPPTGSKYLRAGRQNGSMRKAQVAVVTGASSGIGAATARALAEEGFEVICAARRGERVSQLAAEISGRAVICDVTSDDDVTRLASEVASSCAVLVNNAGGALGLEPVSEANVAAWRWMYEVNVLGTARVTRALLPAVVAGSGSVIFVTSIAADSGYLNGAGYCGVKAAERSMAQSMRQEVVGQPVRVCEIVPGMVHTAEFSLNRFAGDQERAEAVYASTAAPLVAEDIADAIRWVATRPKHVNIDQLVIKPREQAGTTAVAVKP